MTAPPKRLRAAYHRYNRSLPEHEKWVQRPPEQMRVIATDLVWVAVATTAALAIVFRLWEAHPRVPFVYSGDALGVEAIAKNIVQSGWVQTTPRLGAPLGQQLYDYAVSADNGNWLIMRVMAVFTDDWALIVNAFLLLAYYTSAWSAYLCLRWMRCGRTSAVVCAVLFAFSPYHFGRNNGHLLLASYWVVPIGVLLAVRAASGQPLFARRQRSDQNRTWGTVARFHMGSTLPWVLMCFACASFGAYYAIFAVITIVMAAVVVATTHLTVRPILSAASYCGALAAMFFFNVLPNLLYRAEHGANPLVGVRSRIELDLYGLRLIQILTPVPGHWLGPLRAASDDLSTGYQSENVQFFGLVAASALLLMLGWLAIIIVKSDLSRRPDVRTLLGFMTVTWILFTTTGGLNWFTFALFPEIRAWNRISILLMFTSLAWLALTVGPRVGKWVGGARARRRAAIGLATIVMAFGLGDQASASFVSNPDAFVSTFTSDKAFFEAVERELPVGAMVYQLPYRPFPEEPPRFGSGDYDLLRPYLHTESLRWSYGAMKGRESDWQARFEGLSTEELARNVVAAGYQALVIDRAGYEDYGVQIENEFSAVTGLEVAHSFDGRWSFFNLSLVAQFVD